MITEKELFQTTARKFLLAFLTEHDNFLTEDLREWARDKGLEEPYEPRWWGGVIHSAKADGLVKSAGFALAKTSNMSPKVMWSKIK